MAANCSNTSTSRRSLNRKNRKETRKSQKSFFDLDSEEDVVDTRSKDLENLGVTQEKWQTCCINALYNFSYDEDSLRKYETNLEKLIRRKEALLNRLQLSPENIVVNIESFPHMVYNERDNPPIKITVKLRRRASQNWTTCFTGILLSVERNKDTRMEKRRQKVNAVVLPLFLASPNEFSIFICVSQFLEMTFSCLVTRLPITSSDLKWMLALFCPKDAKDFKKEVAIAYRSAEDQLHAYEFNVSNNFLSAVWKLMKTRQENPGEISEDEVEEFNQILRDISKGELVRIGELIRIKTPLAEVVEGEYFKPHASEKLYFVMRYLTHLAQDDLKFFHSLN